MPRAHSHPTLDPIVFVGALHVDELCWPSVPLVLHASNPVRRARRVGGVAANAARAARRDPPPLGRPSPAARPAAAFATRPVTLVAALGDDPEADWLVETLAADGVDCRPVRVLGRASGRYTVVHDDTGELLVGLSDVDIAETLDAESVRASLAGTRAAAVVLDANLSADCLGVLLAPEPPSGIEPGVPRVALAVSPHKAMRLAPHLSAVTLLFCNRREAAALTRMEVSVSLDALADGLVAAGAARFVLSDGPAPVLAHAPEGRRRVPVPPVATLGSVNGAGDALAGATLGHWLAHRDLPLAVLEAGLPAAHAALRAPTESRERGPTRSPRTLTNPDRARRSREHPER